MKMRLRSRTVVCTASVEQASSMIRPRSSMMEHNIDELDAFIEALIRPAHPGVIENDRNKIKIVYKGHGLASRCTVCKLEETVSI